MIHVLRSTIHKVELLKTPNTRSKNQLKIDSSQLALKLRPLIPQQQVLFPSLLSLSLWPPLWIQIMHVQANKISSFHCLKTTRSITQWAIRPKRWI